MLRLEQAVLTTEALVRIIATARHDARQILSDIGFQAFDILLGQAWEMHGNLNSAEECQQLLAFADVLAAAAAYTTPVKKIRLNVPGLRSRTIPVPVEPDESLLDLENAPTNQVALREEIQAETSRLIVRSEAVVQQSRKLIAITDHNGVHLDCNFTQQSFGVDRTEVVGRSTFDLFPELSDISAVILREAVRYPGVPYRLRFSHETVAGIVSQFEVTSTAYGDEVIHVAEPLNPQPWLG